MPAGSRLALWLAAFLAAAACATTGWAGTPDPLIADLFFNLAGDDLAAAGADWSDGARAASEILIAGIPLRVREGAADSGWRTMAGANGRYTLPITGSLTMISRMRLATTDFVDEAAADRSIASAASEFRHAHDGWTFGLQPGLEITSWENGQAQRDSSIEGRISRVIGGGLSLATTGRYHWRTAIGGAALDGEIATGRAGIIYNLPAHLRMNMAYVLRHEVAEPGAGQSRPTVTRSAGPSAALTLPLNEYFDLSASYDFTEATWHDAAAVGRDGETQDLHQIGLAVTWDLGGREADIDLSATYNYGRIGGAAEDQDETRHAGTVSFALDF